MKYLYSFLFIILCFSTPSLAEKEKKAIWLIWTKDEVDALNTVEGLIRKGHYDEAITLCESISKKKSTSKALVSALNIKQAKCYFVKLQIKSVRIKLKETGGNIEQFSSPEEKEAVKFELISYYCFTQELKKADSVFALLTNPQESQYQFEKNYYSAMLHALKGDYKEIFNTVNDPLLSSGESIAFTTLTEDNKSILLQRRLSLSMIKALSYTGYGKYSLADSILKSLTVSVDIPQAWYYESQINFLSGQNLQAQHKYSEAAACYLKVISTKEFNSYSYDHLNSLYLMIENYLRAGNTLDADNYLRRLQMFSIQSSAKKEIAEGVFESAYALSLILKGEFGKAEYRLSLSESCFKELIAHPLRNRVRELYKELYSKKGEVRELSILAEKYSFDVWTYYGENTLQYQKVRLEEARILSVYGGEPFSAVNLYKKHYDNGYSLLVYGNSPERIKYLYDYSEACRKSDALDSSYAKMKSALSITEINFKKESPEFIYAQAKYAQALFRAGVYPEAVSILKSLNEDYSSITKGTLSVQQEFYLIMSELNQIPGEYDLSKKYLTKALNVQNKRSTPDLISQADLEEKSSALFLRTNNFYKAEKALSRSIALKSKSVPPGNLLFFNPNYQYASLKIITGDISSVEKYLKAATNIANEVYGKNSLTSADVAIVQGEYFLTIGDYKKAEELFSSADKTVVSILGKNHLKHAELLLQLIVSRSKLTAFNDKDIEKLYAEAIEIVTTDLGVNNPLYMDIILKQASFFIKNKNYSEAESRLNEAEKYWKNLLGDQVQQIAEIDVLRGDMMYAKNEYVWAMEYYSTARKIYQKVFDENNADYANASSKLARVYYMKNDLSNSIAIMDEIIPKYLDFTVKYFPSMSFRQKQKYWLSIKDEFEFYNTLALNSKSSSPEMVGKAYNNALATKAILLSSSMKILNQVMSGEDTVLIALYNDWVGKKEYLLTILSLSKQQLAEQEIDRGKIEEDITRIEKEMSLRSNLFANEEKKKKLITWENVKEVLQDGEYSVEIIRYRYFNKTFTDSVYYAAFVMSRSTSNPVLVLNNNGINMETRNLKYFRNVATTNVEDAYSYDVYWKSIKLKIPDGSVVYISGDGVYNQINMEMLRHDEGVYAIDENKFVFVSNTKDLLQMQLTVTKKAKESKKNTGVEFLLCGNPDFYSPDSKIKNKKVSSLPGTDKEIKMVNDLLVANNKTPLVYTNAFLTEDTIKKIKNPRVIHIATHGYFKESTASEDDDLANSPLLNSGILFYSAGDILDNHEDKYINQKPGVLTAYEAMNLMLDNTELVVLSACETGRGEVQVGEGVAGLQRSFLLAGSKAIVVSLFKVDDAITQKLMIYFYEDFLKTGDRRNAFAKAKLKIKEEYKNPIFWGAFMMIEGRPERTGGAVVRK